MLSVIILPADGNIITICSFNPRLGTLLKANIWEIVQNLEIYSLSVMCILFQGIGPEQAALAQSQHFDQLEALWNKRSPPRRRHNQVCIT